jgi:hypothetical protein
MTTSIRPGQWYLTAACDCERWIVFDESEGPAARVALPDKIQLTCAHCGKPVAIGSHRVRHARIAREDATGVRAAAV